MRHYLLFQILDISFKILNISAEYILFVHYAIIVIPTLKFHYCESIICRFLSKFRFY